jgi:putative transposase
MTDAGSDRFSGGLDWPHSSSHRDVRAELFPEDWAGDVSTKDDFGERV